MLNEGVVCGWSIASRRTSYRVYAHDTLAAHTCTVCVYIVRVHVLQMAPYPYVAAGSESQYFRFVDICYMLSMYVVYGE